MEVALRLLLEATGDDLLRYDEELEEEVEARWGDEFSVSLELVAEMSPERKLAYLAQLIKSLSLSYGVSLDGRGAGLVLVAGDAPSPAGLLRGLCDESWCREGARADAPRRESRSQTFRSESTPFNRRRARARGAESQVGTQVGTRRPNPTWPADPPRLTMRIWL